AAEGERTEVVAPLAGDMGDRGGRASTRVDRVLGDVGGQVGPGRDARRLRIARIRDLDEGARAGVALTEDEEVIRLGSGQDHEVPLHVPRREACRAARVTPLTDGLADFLRGLAELHRAAS